MAGISVDCDGKALSSNNDSGVYVKISASANNGLSLSNNKLKATKGADGNAGTGGTTNRSGNAIVGSAGAAVSTIACNATVPSKTTVDSGDIGGRINLYDSVIKKILGRS